MAPGSDEVGVLALGGRNPLGYYKDEDKSDRTFKTIDGVRYSIPGDYAQVDADGTIHLLGRGSVCINSGGEKIFPEEVEEALKTHAAVRDAVVVGVPAPDLRRADRGGGRAGRGVTALNEAELIGHVKGRLAHYKAPRRVRSVPTIGRAPNGKVDYKRHRDESMEDMGAVAELSRPDCGDVHRPGRRHARRGGVAALRRAPIPSGTWSPRAARAASCRSSSPPSSCWPATVWLHLVRANPVFGALAENPRVLLSVAGDWAYIPSSWKAIGDEDPALGIPTTYYGAVQLAGTATVHDERTEPGSVAADPAPPAGDLPARRRRWPTRARRTRRSWSGILGIEIRVEQVTAKFKYGGNVDEAHRRAVADRLVRRGGPGDDAAAGHVVRRLGG